MYFYSKRRAIARNGDVSKVSSTLIGLAACKTTQVDPKASNPLSRLKMNIEAVKSVWRFRGYISGSVKREFQIKYRNSILGASWTIINPAAQIFIYTVVFSNLMATKLPNVESNYGYSIYLCSGILIWGLFAEITSRSVNMFLENAALIKKLSFPKICLPITIGLTALTNFVIIYAVFTIFIILSGSWPGVSYFFMPLIIGLTILFSIGLGTILGVLNVFSRDVGQFFGILLSFWFWFTPIVYPLTVLPPKIQAIVKLNPMSILTQAAQKVLVAGELPEIVPLFAVAIVSIILVFISSALLRRASGEMVDEL